MTWGKNVVRVLRDNLCGSSLMAALPRVLLVVTLCLVVCPTAQAQDIDSLAVTIRQATKRSTDDLGAMKKRKLVRALVTPSKTDFFIYKGQPKGLQAEFLHHYEAFLNKDVSRRELKTRIAYVPVPFSELIPALEDGRGDIAAALLTVTPEREQAVNFISGNRWKVNEIIVTHNSVEGLKSIYDLAGRRVYVLRGSSYVEHLKKLNKELASKMMTPIDIVEADPNLLTEDIIELANAGVVSITVVDDFKAALWAKIFPNVVVRKDLVVNEGGHVGWAIRKNNPELATSLRAFLPQVRKGSLLGNMLTKRYFGTTKWIKNPLDALDRDNLQGFMRLFKEYGDEYGFDWLAVVAQAYQESGLDHSVRSQAGAVGIMQLLPSTAASVGFDDITDLDANIHAGVKYVAFLRDTLLPQPSGSSSICSF